MRIFSQEPTTVRRGRNLFIFRSLKCLIYNRKITNKIYLYKTTSCLRFWLQEIYVYKTTHYYLNNLIFPKFSNVYGNRIETGCLVTKSYDDQSNPCSDGSKTKRVGLFLNVLWDWKRYNLHPSKGKRGVTAEMVFIERVMNTKVSVSYQTITRFPLFVFLTHIPILWVVYSFTFKVTSVRVHSVRSRPVSIHLCLDFLSLLYWYGHLVGN